MVDQFSAQDPALGYLYQIRYALWLLLEAGHDDQEEIEVAIEKLDDIDIKEGDGQLRLVQTKHHLSPDFLTNACPDLWKTIRIWCTNFKSKRFQAENTILTIVTTGTAPDKSIASMLRPNAYAKRDLEMVVDQLNKVAQTSENKVNQPAYEIFKSLSREEQIVLIGRIEVLDHACPIIDLRQNITHILRYSARKENINAVYEHLVGWWDELVIKHLHEKSASYLSHTLLTQKIDDIRKQYDENSLPINVPPPTNINVTDLGTDQRTFIEQLKLVRIGDRRVKYAISDFYRASSQRSKWIRDLSISITDLEEFDNKLHREWGEIFGIMEEELAGETNEDMLSKKGREFYGLIMKLNFHIRTRCTEEFITRGSYHMLANQLKLGWHLHYEDLLSQLQNCKDEEAS
jgi:hypothetical protein